MSAHDAYVICTSPRSGSTLLCDLLRRTGIAGDPASYFHRPSVAAWLNHFGLVAAPSASERDVLTAVFEAAIAAGSGDTGLFGLRLQRDSVRFFVRQLAILHPEPPSDAGRFRAAFGRTAFVHLTRRDKVEQAVSYVRAKQSGLWHVAPDGTELERRSPPRAPAYDADAIHARRDALTRQDDAWERWFAREGLDPFRLTYEALSADPGAAVGDVLEHLGLDRNIADGIAPGVAKLADETSRDWVERFHADHPAVRAGRGDGSRSVRGT